MALVAGGALALVIVFFVTRDRSPKSAALTARMRAMELLGQTVAKLRPEGTVLVLSNPFSRQAGLFDEKGQFERAGLNGLRQGLGLARPVEVVFPEIRPEYLSDPQSVFMPADSRTPLSFLIRPGEVDRLAAAHPDCTVVVSLIGLPSEIERANIWREDDKRSLALLLPDLRVLGPPGKAISAFEREKILAAVADDSFQPGNPLIVIRNNVREILERQPQALGY